MKKKQESKKKKKTNIQTYQEREQTSMKKQH